jgi:hypothetical protein
MRFLAWMIIYNGAFVIICAVLIIPFKEPFSKFHAWLFGVEPAFVRQWYFGWIAMYEVLWLFFAVVPYLVLRFQF